MHPGDPAGSARNIINCRCLEIAKILRDGKSVDYAELAFVSSHDLPNPEESDNE